MLCIADSKILIEKARIESQNYWFSHDANIRVESAVQAVSNLAIQFGDSDGDEAGLSRPFGVALLMAGIDPKDGPQLYHMDPSGTYVQFHAKARFKFSQYYIQDMPCYAELIQVCLRITLFVANSKVKTQWCSDQQR